MKDIATITSVNCSCEHLHDKAEVAAQALQVELNDPRPSLYSLEFADEGVHLRANEPGKHGRIMVDFISGSVAHRRRQGGGKGQMIAKAVGLSQHFVPFVLDATAGLGKDAFVLACLGCRVTLLERSPVAYALLEDGLHRARRFAEAQDPDLLAIVERMTLCPGDSIAYLQHCEPPVADVIYLDPMFPERHKNAAVKKEMQAFHAVVGQDPDAEELFSAAQHKAEYRIVVKRPRIAPWITAMPPNYDLSGKSSRYDIYTYKGVPRGERRSAPKRP